MAVNTIEVRIFQVKAFLNAEITHHRTSTGRAKLPVREIGYHMDAIHEFERIGFRNLGDVETLRLNRVLHTIESTMRVDPSNN